MKERKKIILCGSIAIDRIMNFSGSYKDFLNSKKKSLSFSVFLTNLKNSHGGVGANIAFTLALLGEKPVLLGSVGKEATEYIQKLKSLGIDISNIHFSDLTTACFNVISDSKNNQIGGFYPGAMMDSKKMTLKKWKDTSAIIVISPHDPEAMKREVEECSKYKLKMCYDIGQQVSNTPPEEMLLGISNAEILIVNEYEMEVLSKKIKNFSKTLKQKIPLVITTFGAKGSVIEGKDLSKKIKINAIKLDGVSDPTGAGDAYRAGFLCGYVRGLDLKTCGQMGALAASYAISKHGTQEHSFTKKEFVKQYESCFGEKLLLI